MNLKQQQLQLKTRRQFLHDAQVGVGSLALSSLLGSSSSAATSSVVNPLAPKLPPFPAKAKRVIYLHLTGSPPHLDLYDYKPELVRLSGQDAPESFIKGKRFAFTTGTPKLLGTPRTFKQCGQGGVWLSDALPNLQNVADEMWRDQVDVHRTVQSCAGGTAALHRFSPAGTSFVGRLDDVRSGE